MYLQFSCCIAKACDTMNIITKTAYTLGIVYQNVEILPLCNCKVYRPLQLRNIRTTLVTLAAHIQVSVYEFAFFLGILARSFVARFVLRTTQRTTQHTTYYHPVRKKVQPFTNR
jgi:hypothetical protein